MRVNTLDQQCANSGRVVVPATKFCTMTPDIISIFISWFPSPHIRTKMCIISHTASRKSQLTVRCTDHTRIWVLIMDPFWCVVVGDPSQILGKFVDPPYVRLGGLSLIKLPFVRTPCQQLRQTQENVFLLEWSSVDPAWKSRIPERMSGSHQNRVQRVRDLNLCQRCFFVLRFESSGMLRCVDRQNSWAPKSFPSVANFTGRRYVKSSNLQEFRNSHVYVERELIMYIVVGTWTLMKRNLTRIGW